MLSYRSRILNIIAIIYIIYVVYDIFESSSNKVPQIDSPLSETELKIKKIKQEMQNQKSLSNRQDKSFTMVLQEKISNMLDELLGDHLKILQQIKKHKK
jgi:hypothetical protein